jgi:ribosomal subunit interface protein
MMMQIQIDSPRMIPDETLLDRVQSKFEHLGRLYSRIEACDVLLRQEKNAAGKNCYMQAKLELPRGTLFASESAETFEKALENLAEDLEHQLRRHKEELDERR